MLRRCRAGDRRTSHRRGDNEAEVFAVFRPLSKNVYIKLAQLAEAEADMANANSTCTIALAFDIGKAKLIFFDRRRFFSLRSCMLWRVLQLQA